MRRFSALLLLLVAISLSLVSPMLWAGTKKELPACCRRDGKHHCAQNMAAQAPAGVSISAASVCPMFPQGQPAPASAHDGAAPIELGSVAELLTLPPAEAPLAATAPSSITPRPWLQRGPPSLVS